MHTTHFFDDIIAFVNHVLTFYKQSTNIERGHYITLHLFGSNALLVCADRQHWISIFGSLTIVPQIIHLHPLNILNNI